MCDPISLSVAAAVGGLGMFSQAQAASKAADAQKQASDQAMVAANKQADASDQAFNKANGKQPDVTGLMSQNQMAAKGGVSGTMLTGPQGVDPKTLLLGKTTLLGG